MGWIPGWEDPWRRAWQSLQHSCLEKPICRGAGCTTVRRVRQCWIGLKWLSSYIPSSKASPHIHTCLFCFLYFNSPWANEYHQSDQSSCLLQRIRGSVHDYWISLLPFLLNSRNTIPSPPVYPIWVKYLFSLLG